MSNTEKFDSVWDALEDDPVRRENLKLRSSLMMGIAERIKSQGLTQAQAAEAFTVVRNSRFLAAFSPSTLTLTE